VCASPARPGPILADGTGWFYVRERERPFFFFFFFFFFPSFLDDDGDVIDLSFKDVIYKKEKRKKEFDLSFFLLCRLGTPSFGQQPRSIYRHGPIIIECSAFYFLPRHFSLHKTHQP
jgi:hypothetical protein